MSKFKKQHYVPACYLKAWCDPDAPPTQTPYVWVFDKGGSNARRKAPENIFHETDMYTIHRANGDRDLVLEHGLHQLETKFTKIRNNIVKHSKSLDVVEHIALCAFVAAAQARTPSMREHHRQQWERPLRMMEDMMEWMKTATPSERQRVAAVPSLSSNSKGISYEDVKQLYENPTQTLLFPSIQATTPLLCNLDMAFLVTNDDIGFITSDHPCVWYDPEAYKRHPFYRSPAIGYKTIEITLPLSPSHCLFINRQGYAGFIDVNSRVVDDLNRRVRFASQEYFVVHKSIINNYWFEQDELPDDSWENTHSQIEEDD